MPILESPSKLFVNPGAQHEPIRPSHHLAIFTNPGGTSSSKTESEHLRAIRGLNQPIAAKQYAPGNFALSIPQLKAAANVTLEYMVMASDKGGNAVINFWDAWHNLAYDHESDAPGLFGDIIGSGRILVYSPVNGGSTKQFMEISLWGIWPQNVILGDLAQGESGLWPLTIELSVTRIQREMKG